MFISRISRILGILLVAFTLTEVALTHGQDATDVFPAVVFLQGSDVKRETLNQKQIEIWYREAGAEKPVPLKLVTTGTGFIVMFKKRFFLITAHHVAANIPMDATATLRGDHDDPLTFPLSELTGSTIPHWVSHSEADVAVLPLAPPDSFKGAIKAVAFEQLASHDHAPPLDEFLTTVGFPLNLGVSGKFSPIVRTSHAASGLFRQPRFDNGVEATFFILEDPTVSGFSGAPLFRLPRIRLGAVSTSQGDFACVGLVHGNLNDPTGAKFAAIVPARFIAETVTRAAEGG